MPGSGFGSIVYTLDSGAFDSDQHAGGSD